MPAILLMFVLVWIVVVFSPFAARGWKSFLFLCATFLAFGLGVRWGVARYDAADVPGFLVETGNLWLDTVVPFLPVVTFFRALGLIAKSLGLHGGKLLALNIACILAVPATFLAPGIWQAWDNRAAPEICMTRPVPIEIGGIRADLPHAAAIRLYLGPSLREDARYFFSRKSQRQLCADTSNGTVARKVMAVVVRLDFCSGDKLSTFQSGLCGPSGGRGRLPHDVTLFVPDCLRLGYFGIPIVRTSEPPTDGMQIVRAKTKDGKELAAHCRPDGTENAGLICEMRRAVRPEIDITWEFYVQQATVSQTLIETDATAQRVCAMLLGQNCAVQP